MIFFSKIVFSLAVAYVFAEETASASENGEKTVEKRGLAGGYGYGGYGASGLGYDSSLGYSGYSSGIAGAVPVINRVSSIGGYGGELFVILCFEFLCEWGILCVSDWGF